MQPRRHCTDGKAIACSAAEEGVFAKVDEARAGQCSPVCPPPACEASTPSASCRGGGAHTFVLLPQLLDEAGSRRCAHDVSPKPFLARNPAQCKRRSVAANQDDVDVFDSEEVRLVAASVEPLSESTSEVSE